MSAPIFLLGLGAQKAGTSWLHDFLSGSQRFAGGVAKEYHVFDALHLDEEKHVLDRRPPGVIRTPLQFARSVLRAHGAFRERERISRQLREHPLDYPNYFRGLVDQNPGVRLTGDFTPEYGALPPEVLGDIKANMEGAGFEVRAILLLRDPVERCLSASRMYIDRTHRAEKKREFEKRGLDITQEGHAFTPHAEARTRYDKTLAAADQVFPAEALFVGFYEEMFTNEETRRFTDWLGIEPIPADFDKRVNASSGGADSKRAGADPALRARIANHYRPVYEDMFRRFGEERVRELWPSAALLE